jgi:hypothetical protein
MKMIWRLIVIGLLSIPIILRAEYHIDWATLGGGGGVSAGGVYTVSGTIGQAQVGTASGDNYDLVTGFWSILATEETPGAPRLSIQAAGDSLRLFWASSAIHFVLEQTTTLSGSPAVPWSPGAFVYQTNATHISVTIPMPTGDRFFRLRKP